MLNIANSDLRGALIFNRDNDGIYFRDDTNYLGLGIDFSSGNYIGQVFLIVSSNDGTGEVILYDNTPTSLPAVTPPADINLVVNNLTQKLCAIPKLPNEDPLPIQYTFTQIVFLQEGNVIDTKQLQVTRVVNYTLSGEYEGCITTTVSCQVPAVMVKDQSKYGIYAQSITRNFNLYPPPTAGTPAKTGIDADTIIYTRSDAEIAQGNWSALLRPTVLYIQADGLEVIKTWNTQIPFTVSCDNVLNNIICCLQKLKEQEELLKATEGPRSANIHRQNKINPIESELVWYIIALIQGDADSMAKQYQKLKDVSGCGNCKGCGDKAQQFVVVPGAAINPGVEYEVTSTGGTIAVSVNVGATKVTYNVEVSPALVQQIQNKFNTTVIVDPASATDIQVTLDPSSTASNKIYVIKLLTGGNNVNQINTMDLEITIVKNPGITPYYNISRVVPTRRGFLFWSNPVVSLGTNAPNTPTDYAVIRIVDIFIPTLVPSSPQFSVYPAIQSVPAVEDLTSPTNIDIQCYYKDGLFVNGHVTGYVTLRLYDPSTGMPLKLQDLDTLVDTLVIACRIVYPSV